MLSFIRKMRLQEKELRILLLYVQSCVYTSTFSRHQHANLLDETDLYSGLDGAGKSSICAALMNEDLDEVSPTLGFEIKTVERDGFKLNICEFVFITTRSASPPSYGNHLLTISKGMLADKRL
jgi:ADP-ribosylation factor-like protein 2